LLPQAQDFPTRHQRGKHAKFLQNAIERRRFGIYRLL